MIVGLDEMKGYLRVEFDDDELGEIPSSKIAVMYAVAYLYEHREDADHHQLTISLRSLLEGVRRSVF